MRQFFSAAIAAAFFFPVFVQAQSLEWLAEHPGVVTPALSMVSTTVATQTPVSTARTDTNDGLESKVRAYFSDIPVMASIAECESRFRQFGKDGHALDGGAGGMIGLFQINVSVHAALARSMGMDIYTTDGNLAYARYLYQQDGTNPWLDSFSCWHKIAQSQSAVGGSNALTEDLVLGTVGPEVRALQVLLNTHGYVLTSAGAGSPGQETEKFGALTRSAVRKFQCEKMQICSGDEASNGYGLVGASTRGALLALTGEPPVTASAQVPVTIDAADDAQIAALKQRITELTSILESLQARRAS